MHVLDRVRATIQRHCLATPSTRVLLAVSGGSDSTALAWAMRELDAARDLQVTAIAHFNHQLRASAARDEAFVATLADRLGWSIIADRGDVATRARRERRSIEDAARASRHEFFERARVETGADVVALGHTRDDQAETFLLRLLRGAGSRGVAAMHPRRGALIRPLLDCRRDDLRAYLRELDADFVDDESNAELSVPRNRVRAELLPALARFNPAIVDVLADHADLAREEGRWIEAAAAQLETRAAEATQDSRIFDAAALRDAPLALRRLVIWRALQALAGARSVGFRHVQAALEWLERPEGTLDLPGQRLERFGARLVLTNRPIERVNLFAHPLSIPGEVRVPEAGVVLSVEVGESARVGRASATGPVAIVRQDRCAPPFIVRNRRPGDRFRPVGLDGRKKLQDFFVDRKVARARRDAVPLVVDAADRIVWVAGYGIDAAFRVTDPSQAVLIFKVRDLGGSV